MNFKSYAPQKSFIRSYMEYMDGVETPQSFDFFTGLWIVGASCGNLYINRPRHPVLLNHYTVLCSNSGHTRREYNVRYAKRFTGRASIYEEYEHYIGKDKSGKDAVDYCNNGYNHDHTLLVTTTPVKLFNDCHAGVTAPDLASKCLFVYDDERKRAIAWPREDVIGLPEAILRRTISDVKEISQLEINDIALRSYSSWYRKRYISRDPFLSVLESRDDEHLLRIAGILCVNDGILEIQSSHISKAIRLLHMLKDGRDRLFSGIDLGSGGRIVEAIEKVRKKIITVGIDGVRDRDIYRDVRSNISLAEFRLLMRIMHETSIVEKIQVSKTNGRSYNIYRPTSGIVKEAVASEVLSRMVPHQY
jgi:hypothetical protein